ncbi:ribonuclease Y [Clostridium tepidiprofundi DSM 19306]|uniref:Ribonuclease Y n=1 Tax=Clostridium tepidiprofundi DSM 19306 TaxID=1121338 RepID=A0A151B554_9CLOT|nr:HD domain-containing protein [Clostridium tepidiprofundi]KYH35038.1 ribonuclease Y [Clostridium tepidiprofundi DSM 19306]
MNQDMSRVNQILKHKEYLKNLNKNINDEINRKFCHHDLVHFLDVSRIMYIKSLENDLKFDKEIIYACGLLHDIGKWQQYEEGVPHEIASANIAKNILKECSFNDYEIDIIVDAIINHRNNNNPNNSLSELLYKSDKLSRMCFNCNAQAECNWSIEMRNNQIKY